ncbi:MAG: hypothetical protein ACREBG_02070 [Pyrinomonadaceae bacterium]
MSPKPTRLLKVVLVLTAITMIAVWLPLIRGLMDGASYQWGNSFLSWSYGGQGLGGAYWLIALQAAFCVALLYLGWRGGRPPFHWILLLWNFAHAVDACYNALLFPERYRFQGDTLGVDVSLAWVGPVVFGGLAVLSLIWVVSDLKRHQTKPPPTWTRKSRILLWLTIGIIPVQFFLLRFGVPHGTTDQIGVLLTMLQWAVLNWSFAASVGEPFAVANGSQHPTQTTITSTREASILVNISSAEAKNDPRKYTKYH